MTTFIDKARIFLRAGAGGNGCLSFRREKYVPLGGPNGGNGGDGGSIFLIGNPNLTTLIDVTYRPHFYAEPGASGRTKNMYGKKGEDLRIHMPCGTVVYKNGAYFIDLLVPHQEVLVCQGGRGGRGNASFKTARQTAPRIAERGQPGETAILDLELKVLADVGLVGYPNAGKSTLLSRISNAHPKIADYPFTTLTPNLGVVTHKGKHFAVADIPGIIENAHAGKGLGIEFLRHIERTKVLIHVVDLFGFDGDDAFQNWLTILNELRQYGHDVNLKPTVVALNKIDMPGWEEKALAFKAALRSSKKSRRGAGTFVVTEISGATGKGITAMLDAVIEALAKLPAERAREPHTVVSYGFEPEFLIAAEGNAFRVRGKKVEDFVSMTNFDEQDSVLRLQRILKKIGVEKALKKKGIVEGQAVKIGTLEFEFKDW